MGHWHFSDELTCESATLQCGVFGILIVFHTNQQSAVCCPYIYIHWYHCICWWLPFYVWIKETSLQTSIVIQILNQNPLWHWAFRPLFWCMQNHSIGDTQGCTTPLDSNLNQTRYKNCNISDHYMNYDLVFHKNFKE